MRRLVALAPGVVAAIRDEARARAPEEACGALVGVDGSVLEVVPIANSSGDRRRSYLMAPEDLLAVDRAARERSLAIVGYYHSHPSGSAEPSPTDLESAWPETLYVIAGVAAAGRFEIRGWWVPGPGEAFEPVTLETRETEIESETEDATAPPSLRRRG